jgi:hypothetical protein
MLPALLAALLATAPATPPEPPRPVCHWEEAAPKPLARSGYSLCVFGENWFEMELGYEMKPALDRLGQHPAKEALACFGAESIDQFDWDKQRLTLNREATGRLVQALGRYEDKAQRTAAKADFAEGEQRLKNLIRSLGWSSAIEMDLRLRVFQVRVDGKLVYGGIFLDPTSQMGIDFPVARVDAASDCRAAFNFLPTHLPFLTEDPIDEAGNVRKLDVTPEAQEDVQNLDEDDNFFSGWATERALAPNALAMRKLMRDPAIRRSLQKAGKLPAGPEG